MRIVHCPPNESPPVYARKYAKKGGGRSMGNLWMVLALVGFVAWTVLAGPLKKQEPPQKAEATPAPVAAALVAQPVRAEPVLCTLPAGGRIEVGWTAIITDGEKFITVRCMEDGTLEEENGEVLETDGRPPEGDQAP